MRLRYQKRVLMRFLTQNVLCQNTVMCQNPSYPLLSRFDQASTTCDLSNPAQDTLQSHGHEALFIHERKHSHRILDMI